MLPIGPLMIEHRLIERMIALLRKEVDGIERGKDIHAGFLDTAIDFIRTYVDRGHHGKEEEILYRKLEKKPLSVDHRRILGEILEEHGRGKSKIFQWGQRIVIADHQRGPVSRRVVSAPYRQRGPSFLSALHGVFQSGRKRSDAGPGARIRREFVSPALQRASSTRGSAVQRPARYA